MNFAQPFPMREANFVCDNGSGFYASEFGTRDEYLNFKAGLPPVPGGACCTDKVVVVIALM